MHVVHVCSESIVCNLCSIQSIMQYTIYSPSCSTQYVTGFAKTRPVAQNKILRKRAKIDHVSNMASRLTVSLKRSRLCFKVSEQHLVCLLYNGSRSDLERLVAFPPKTVELQNVKG